MMPKDKVKQTADKTSRPFKGKRYPRVDPYRQASDSFIEAIESGMAPWDRAGPMTPPRNAATGRQYNGINFSALSATPFKDPRWCTFNQAKAQGWVVPKGAKATRIYLHKQIDIIKDADKGKDDPDNQGGVEQDVKQIPYLETFCVFNAEQLENVSADTPRPPPAPVDIEGILDGLGITVEHAPADASIELTDTGIRVPDPESFNSIQDYEATVMQGVALHVALSSEHNKGFDPALAKLGDPVQVAMLRLRAQMAAVMLSSEYGLPACKIATDEDIGYWTSTLRHDKKAIFSASRDAWRICDVVAQNAPLPEFMLDEVPGTNLESQDMDALFGDTAALVPDKKPRVGV